MSILWSWIRGKLMDNLFGVILWGVYEVLRQCPKGAFMGVC